MTRRRIVRHRASPSLKHLVIDYCYAVDSTPEEQEMDVLQMMNRVTNGSLDEVELLRRIDKKVASFRPDILIVHAGFVFSTFPRVVLSALSSLKSKYPELRIGSEAPDRIDPIWKEMFDNTIEQSPELNSLATLVV